MLLKDYIANIDKKYSKTFFSGISSDSSKVKKNNIFFAIKGNKFDGNDYINLAIKKGAKIIVSEQKINQKKENIIFLHSLNIRKLLSEISFKILDKKPKKLVAVTGTNGKTSTVEFLYQIWTLLNINAARIGTLGVKSKEIGLTLLSNVSVG